MTGTGDLCTMCNKSQTLFCSRCHSTRYCSKECQQADWPLHKLLCSKFTSFTSSRRPSKDYFVAILFPPDENKPRFVWLQCKWHDDDVGGRFQLPDAGTLLGDAVPWTTPLQFNTSLDRKLSDTISICARDTLLVDGSKPNKSITNIIKDGLGHDWRGPLFAYGKDGQGLDPPDCRDLDMMDFRHIVDYLFWYDSEALVGNQRYLGKKIKGIKINCLGDQKNYSLPPFEAVEVPSTHPIFYSNDISEIAKRIGLPILTRQYPSDPKWENEFFDGHSATNNQDATFLHLSCDPNAKFDLRTGDLGWGWAPTKWQNSAGSAGSVGSVVVVREDKKPLHPWHMEALCQYCRREIAPLFEHSVGGYAPEEPMSKSVVLSSISRATFIILWYKFLRKKREEGKREFVESPYDVK